MDRRRSGCPSLIFLPAARIGGMRVRAVFAGVVRVVEYAVCHHATIVIRGRCRDPYRPVQCRRPDGMPGVTGWTLNGQSVGLQTQGPEVPTPSGPQSDICESFSESKNVVLSRCRRPPPVVLSLLPLDFLGESDPNFPRE